MPRVKQSNLRDALVYVHSHRKSRILELSSTHCRSVTLLSRVADPSSGIRGRVRPVGVC